MRQLTKDGILIIEMPSLDHLIVRKKSMHLKLITFDNGQCAIGNLYHGDELICHTMEKPYLHNKNDVSCVPAGLYDLNYRVSHTQGETFYLSNPKLNVTLDTEGTRTYIQFDVANIQSELLGCIALGLGFGIYKNEWSVTDSGKAKAKLMPMLGKGKHTLEIKRF